MKLLVLLFLFVTPVSLYSQLRLARLFSDHGVLQQGKTLPVWGWAGSGETVEARLADQTQTTSAASDGRWQVQFSPLPAGGPHTLTVTSRGAKVEAVDLLIGEVWLGAGQSNMAMTVSRAQDYERERATAALPQIRMFTVGGKAADQPAQDCSGQWRVCTPETVGSFSATAFFFGRRVQEELKVPIGLITTAVGGTPIESWNDAASQRAIPELAPMFSAAHEVIKFDPAAATVAFEQELEEWRLRAREARAKGEAPPRAPRNPVEVQQRRSNVGGLFNGKVAPLIPYAVKGMLWYQGEANSEAQKAPLYRHQLALLVTDWRRRWGDEALPFAWVQLPNLKGRGESWCLVREAMLQTLALPHTGMAITLDIGDDHDVHPKNKQDVGARLAMWALGSVYGRDVAVSGPRYLKHEIIGPHVVVKMSHTDGGLVGRHDLQGFVICGEDRKWKAAEVKIDGHKLFISSPEVPRPVAVRYAWADSPVVSLWNGAGLPASPFRTDRFPASDMTEVKRAVLRRSAADN
jgi:sialate O-acetylesterase